MFVLLCTAAERLRVPMTLFINIEKIMGYPERHAARQDRKLLPALTDPEFWVYEIVENGDCSADAAICDNVKDLVHLFRRLDNAKLTFANKFVNRELLNYDPQRKTRIGFSLMPHQMPKLVDVRTTPLRERIAVMKDFLMQVTKLIYPLLQSFSMKAVRKTGAGCYRNWMTSLLRLSNSNWRQRLYF